MAGRVLYVDDDRTLCQIVAKALDSEGYAVESVYDGEQAVAHLAGDPPDLVLLDLLLPGLDGFEVLEQIRAFEEPTCDIPVVLVSGCTATPAYASRANSLGALDLLTKPVPLADLVAVVKRHIGEAKPAAPAAPEAARAPAAEVKGTLERIPFPMLLHHLHGMRATGVLQLVSEKKRKWIQLRDGYPVAVRSNLVRETLGHYLVRTGAITRAVLDECVSHMNKGKRQGEILVAMEVLSEDRMVQVLRDQADEKLFEIFSWESGFFRFDRGRSLSRANVLGIGRSPANLILEGVRSRTPMERIDGYFAENAGRLVAHGESPFYRFQDIKVEDSEEALLRGLDGTQSLGDFRAEEESFRRTVFGLIAAGFLELHGGQAGQPSRRAAPDPATRARRVERARVAAKPRRERSAPAKSAPKKRAPKKSAPAESAPKKRAPKKSAPAESAPKERAPGHDPRQEDGSHLELVKLAERLRGKNHYELLGVRPEDGRDVLREAYERLAAQTHPDHFSGAGQALRDLADELHSLAKSAYDTLRNPRARQQYALDEKKRRREEATRRKSEIALEAESEFRKGEMALDSRDYESALAHFGRALQLYPDEGDHHAHYGWALHLCHPGDTAMAGEALEHVKRGLKLASHREKPYLFLGRLYKVIGRVDLAERMFARAARIQPECVDALRELRLINMRRQKSKGLIGRLLRR
jgi:CheY-like chemotaxis protein/tetratricopeptide (TPR) repeat protein